MRQYFVCAECGRDYPLNEIRYRCDCGEPLDIAYDGLEELRVSRETFDARLERRTCLLSSGVWRFRELLPQIEDESVVSRPEGNTNLYRAGADEPGGLRRVGEYAGLGWLGLKH